MEIHYTVTPAVLYRAQREIARHIPWMRWSGVFVCAAFPVLMVGLTLAYGGTVAGAFLANWPTMVGLPLFWLLVIPLIQRWGAGRLLRNTPSFHGPQATRVDAAGVHTRSPVGAADVGWAAVVRVVESRSFFLLFQSKAMALFIPKAAFAGPSELDEFRHIVGEAIGHRASWRARVEPAAAAT